MRISCSEPLHYTRKQKMGLFDSDSILFGIGIFEMICMSLIVTSALLYIILICSNRRFHSTINAITMSYSLAALTFALFYLCYFGLTFRDDYFTVISIRGCALFNYFIPFVNGSVVYSLGIVSFNRLCMIVFHNKRIFKAGRWVAMCIACQWILAAVVSLPHLLLDPTVSSKKDAKIVSHRNFPLGMHSSSVALLASYLHIAHTRDLTDNLIWYH